MQRGAERRVVADPAPRGEKVIPPALPWCLQPRAVEQPQHPVRLAEPRLVDPAAIFVEPGIIPPGGSPKNIVLLLVLGLSGGTMATLLLIFLAIDGHIGSDALLLSASAGAFMGALGLVLAICCIQFGRSWHPWPLAIHRVGESVLVQRAGTPHWECLSSLSPALGLHAVRLAPEPRWRLNSQAGELVWGVWLQLSGSGRMRFVLLETCSDERAGSEGLILWCELLGLDPAVQDQEIQTPEVVYERRSKLPQIVVRTDFSGVRI